MLLARRASFLSLFVRFSARFALFFLSFSLVLSLSLSIYLSIYLSISLSFWFQVETIASDFLGSFDRYPWLETDTLGGWVERCGVVEWFARSKSRRTHFGYGGWVEAGVARSGNWLGVEVYKLRGLTRLRKESAGVLC